MAEDARSEVIQLAELSAKILVMCDGIRTVKQIADHIAVTEPPVGDILPEKVCLFGLELLRQQGLVVAHSFAGSSLAAG